MHEKLQNTRAVLLVRRGLTFVEPSAAEQPESVLRAVDIELAAVGFAASTKLRACLRRLATADLAAWLRETTRTLSEHKGGGVTHEPLFRRFPDDVPADTEALWWRKVLCHYLQADDQPCLFCERIGTTHVLNPCCHVVCDRCFDGSSYSACPVCEHHVDRRSPFFTSVPLRGLPDEPRMTLRRLDLGDDLLAEARDLFARLVARTQALSPDDTAALTTLLEELGAVCLRWLPDAVPLKENVALVFGTLFRVAAPDEVLPVARAHLKTATDVLRFLAAFSGASPSLQGETVLTTVDTEAAPPRFLSALARWLGAPAGAPRQVVVGTRVKRFKMAKLPRPLRRALLSLLEGLPEELLVEDMLRHRSYWVWAGQWLHPSEHKRRFPKVARAFEVVRKKAPDGTRAPAFETWTSRFERAAGARDVERLTAVLCERPGELARRFDHALRLCGDDPAALATLTRAFVEKTPAFSTPVLLTLKAHLATRTKPAKVRVYFPKGASTKGVSAPDERAPLSSDAIAPALGAIEAELIARFAKLPPVEGALIDEALVNLVVPFNERTASRSAVSLPRGSRLDVPTGDVVRLFLHWCQPEGGVHTDLDLSVGFYDAAWRYTGVCSYYELQLLSARGATIAKSAGDLRSAPHPDGATELVDIYRAAARHTGVRYAVMVVNAYSGMAMSQLERAFAGMMLRDDAGGAHFDPRTVTLRFDLQGENGVYLPFVLDLDEQRLWWLDVYSTGALAMNNVATSNADITRVCPALMDYFASDARPSLYDLALLHAAARCRRVLVRRGDGVRESERRAGEAPLAFYRRLVSGEGAAEGTLPDDADPPVLAALLEGDIELPRGSLAYALFPTVSGGDLHASDLLS